MSRIFLGMVLAALLGFPARAQTQGQEPAPPAEQSPPAAAQDDQSATPSDQAQPSASQQEQQQPQPKKKKKSKLKEHFSSGCVAGVGCWGDKQKSQPGSGQQQTPDGTSAGASSQRSPKESSSNETQIDLSPPGGETGQPSGSGEETVLEMHPWDPHRAAKDIEVGDLYRRQGNYRAAVSRYRDALDYKANDAEATFHMAESLEKLGEVEDAAAYFESYLKILPHGDYVPACQEALARLRPLLGNRPPAARSEQGENDLQMGEFYFSLTNYPAAAERFLHALELKPDDSMAHLRLAQAMQKMGKAAEAHQHYQAYLSLLPNGPFAAEARKELARMGPVPELAKAPAKPDVTPDLQAGESALDSGNFSVAAEHFRKALAVEPENPRALFRLAQALEGLGDRQQALAGYQHYLKVDPNGPFSIPALQALDRLSRASAQATSPPAQSPR